MLIGIRTSCWSGGISWRNAILLTHASSLMHSLLIYLTLKNASGMSTVKAILMSVLTINSTLNIFHSCDN
jgi:hypothetical protein